ncbi:MAG: CDP-glycerol glycerophosphotransferase family protein [Pirellulales bacterium]
MLATGHLVPVVVLARDSDGTMQRMCRDAGVSFESESRRRSPFRARPKATKVAGRVERGGRHVGLLHWSARVLRAHWQLARWLRRSVSRLRRLRPAVLVLLDDRTLRTCHWIRAAEWLGIPSVTVQWAAFHRQESLVALRLTGQRETSRLVQAIERRVASSIPQATVQRDGQIAWLMPVEHTIAHYLLGALPRTNAWAFGGGNSNAVALAGMAWKRRVALDGVPKEKLVVTGHPDQDQWFRLAQTWNDQQGAELKKSLEIESDKIVITLVAPAMAFRAPGASRSGEVAVEDLHEDLRTVVRTACSFDDRIVVVVKVHPRDTLESLRFLRDEFATRLRLVANCPLDRLIAASQAMVCQWSTAAMIGQALRTPVIVVQFRDSPSSDVWKGAAGLDAAKTPVQLRQALRQCLRAPQGRQSRLAAQDAFVREHLCFDGKASQRIVELIERQSASITRSTKASQGR